MTGRNTSAAESDPTLEPSVPDHLLTIDEAAAYLNVPARWVAEAVRRHRIRCTRIGKHVRFRVAHLEELIVAGEQPVLDWEEVATPRRRGRSKL